MPSPPARSVTFLEAVAAGAVFAVASVADMDPVQLAVHPVAVESAFRHAAGYALVHFKCHDGPSSLVVFPFFGKIS